MKQGLNHLDEAGNAIMVDVSQKSDTMRTAVAKGSIFVGQAVFEAIQKNDTAKGDVLGIARVAGIMAVKRTSDLIPMCHPLMLTKAILDFRFKEDLWEIEAICTAKVTGKTGVEMEALTGASVALLTIYDMCKSMNRSMTIKEIYLLEKTGGKSGHYERGYA